MKKNVPLFRSISILTLLVCFNLFAGDIKEKVRSYRAANERKILNEFINLLSIPNVASDRLNIGRNAGALVQMLKARGLTTTLLDAEDPNAPRAVLGELKIPGATQTLVFYAHYDGQPTDSTKWTQSKPWQPVVRTNSIEEDGMIVPISKQQETIGAEWRVYGRSASDDKSPIIAILSAIDALKASGIALTSNLKLFFEGEEEAGSPHLESVVRRHADLLKGDVWIICDGPVHQNGQKLMYFGVRGIVSAEITLYGANRALHSGHYGNWSPNPAMMLSQLLASMKDEDGRVLVAGFYDDAVPLGEHELQALKEAPDYDKTLMHNLGIARVEGSGQSLNELISLPSLNIDGIASAYVGMGARTIVPATATARVDMRLVKGNDHTRQLEKLKAHIRKQGYFIVENDPDAATRLAHPKIAKVTGSDGYNACRTPMDLPIALTISEAVQSVCEKKVVRMPTLGGSVPIIIFEEILKAPQIGVPIVNYDNNQHGENENVRIQNLWDGIEIYAAIMAMPR